jgi:hypothetical protein
MRTLFVILLAVSMPSLYGQSATATLSGVFGSAQRRQDSRQGRDFHVRRK